jgi:membrane protease YdiL (CAAX protease family)
MVFAFLAPIIQILTAVNINYLRYIFAILFYFGFTLIVFLEIRNLKDFHLDHLTLWTIVISCFLPRRFGLEGEIYFSYVRAAFGFLIFAIIFINRSQLPKTNPESIIVGAVLGCVILLPMLFFESFQPQYWRTAFYEKKLLFAGIGEFILNLQFVTPMEEAIFRGLLIGYLIRFGYKIETVFMFQAVLFWAMHVLTKPLITYWISIPLLSLSATWLVYRYKQIFPSIIVHTLTNVLGPIILNIAF